MIRNNWQKPKGKGIVFINEILVDIGIHTVALEIEIGFGEGDAVFGMALVPFAFPDRRLEFRYGGSRARTVGRIYLRLKETPIIQAFLHDPDRVACLAKLAYDFVGRFRLVGKEVFEGVDIDIFFGHDKVVLLLEADDGVFGLRPIRTVY